MYTKFDFSKKKKIVFQSDSKIEKRAQNICELYQNRERSNDSKKSYIVHTTTHTQTQTISRQK